MLQKFLGLAALTLIAPTAAAQQQSAQTIAIVDTTVLPMTGKDRLTRQTVVVIGDRIVAVGDARKIRIPAGSRTIDGRGKVLMPGLVDMHIHLAPTPGELGDPAQRALAVMLAHGITTARTMAGSPQNLEVRGKVESGKLAGPRIYAAAPAMHDKNTTTADQAQAAVRKAKAAGFDLIKSHELSDVAVWQAVQDEAKRQGIAVGGHVSNAIGIDRAIAAGQQVEHLDGIPMALLPADAPERQAEFGQIPPPPVAARVMQVDEAQFAALAARIRAARSWHVPTLSLFEKILDISTPTSTLSALPEMRFIPPNAATQWAAQREGTLQQGLTAQDGQMIAGLRRRIALALHRAGVPLMAGSDTAQSFHVWGPALHQEIRSLANAGLGPMAALRAATSVPRDYLRSLPNNGSALGWKADFGTVEAGARADLVLLSGDPSQNLAALDRPDVVIAAGRMFDRPALDAMLAKASADAKAPPVAAAAAAPPAAAKHVYVMRHLAAAQGTDPGLTEAGQAQAASLHDFLRAGELKAVFATPYKRAQQTAGPIAQALGLPVTTYNPADPAGLLQAAASVAGNVLIVGHSNTVPDIIGRLGGAQPAIGEKDFGSIFRADSGSRLIKRFELGGVAPAKLEPCHFPGLMPGSRCGTITVAENRAKPNGRKIPIRFAVFPAREEATDDPIVVLPGGPGLGGVQGGAGNDQMFGAAIKSRDIVMIDQRGAGESNPLVCPTTEDDENPLGQLGESSAAQVTECRDLLSKKADLRFYHTREAVKDMELVRAALGYGRFDLFGMSYGTRVALDYLRLYPDRVGQTVIRAAAPVDMTLPLWTPRDTQLSFDRMTEACAAQPDCAAKHPDLKGDLRAMLALLEKGPAPISIKDPRNGKTLTGELSRSGLGTVMFSMLYIPEFYSQLPPLLAKARTGEFSPLVQAASPFLLGVGDMIAWGMNWSVVCNEDVSRIDRTKIGAATRGTFFGEAPVREELANCSKWPRAVVPADYLKPVRSDKPVLIISGYLDPVAGKAWGDVIARTLPNSLHVEVPGASHLPPLPGCTQALAGEFYAGKPLGQLDTGCVAQAPRPKMKV